MLLGDLGQNRRERLNSNTSFPLTIKLTPCHINGPCFLLPNSSASLLHSYLSFYPEISRTCGWISSKLTSETLSSFCLEESESPLWCVSDSFHIRMTANRRLRLALYFPSIIMSGGSFQGYYLSKGS